MIKGHPEEKVAEIAGYGFVGATSSVTPQTQVSLRGTDMFGITLPF
jgi:hypothetical protein